MKNRKQVIQEIDRQLTKIIGVNLPILKKVKRFVIKSGGKRFRPLFHYTLVKILGSQDKAWPSLGAIGELVHGASLLHDDVIDEAKVRRQQPSLNAFYENKVSILSGDYLLACALEHLSTLPKVNLYLPLFTRCIRNLAVGELLQLEHEAKFPLSEKIYFEIIYKKTACLFGVMSETAYLFSQKNIDKKTSLLYRNFGENLGKVFQMRDDYLDYYGDGRDKELYQDLRRGLVTWPLLLLYKSCNWKERRELKIFFYEKSYKKRESLCLDLMDKMKIQKKMLSQMEIEIHSLMAFARRHKPSLYRENLISELSRLLIHGT